MSIFGALLTILQRLNDLNSTLYNAVKVYDDKILELEGNINTTKNNVEAKRQQLFAVKKHWGDRIEIAMNNVCIHT